MKKNLLCTLLVFFALNCVNAQVIGYGDKIITAGLGFGSYLGGNNYSLVFPPIGASFEYCIIDYLFDENSAIGVGGYLGYTANKWRGNEVEVKYTYTAIAGKGYFHYNFARDLDTYAGLILGYNVVGRRISPANASPHTSSSGLVYSLFLGARYYFSPDIGAYAELGYGIATLELGVAFRL